MDIILQGTVGSTAYGLNTENSDIDTLGTYVAPMPEVLGMNGNKAVDNSVVEHEPDGTWHELGKFFKLASAGNPTILELLFLNEYTVKEGCGKSLIEYRSSFLSEERVRNAYAGYAYQQAKKLLNRNQEGKLGFGDVPVNRIKKHGRHVGRLMYMGEQLLTTGNMNINCSDRREELFALGELAFDSPQRFFDEFSKELERFDSLKSVLPEKPDYEFLNNMLAGIRMLHA